MTTLTTQPKAAFRGDGTRERLLIAAVELFGQRGFEGVGAREITGAAGVPLSAIPYYFKTMELLYRAAIERVCTHFAQALAPASARAAESIKGSPKVARQALKTFQADLLDVLAVNPQAQGWAKLLLREHLDPGPAFDLVYDNAARGAIDLMAALIARADGSEQVDEAALLKAFACMGEVLIFRAVQTAAVRRLGWKRLGKPEAARIARALW
jgi:TetR/AcrR family transcriptional regulator, regulator of cefoperazone and chloramphenicol sensitivity